MDKQLLYEIPQESKIKVEEGLITFHHTDGMYSFCTCDWIPEDDEGGNIVHLSVMTPLVKKGDYYEIVEQDE